MGTTAKASDVTLVSGLKILEPEPLEHQGICPGGKYTYYGTLAGALPLLRHWATYNQKPIALDLETGIWQKGEEPDPARSPIYLMSCSTRRGEAHVFDTRALHYEDDPLFRETMRRFLEHNVFVCHNAQFEQAFLASAYGVMIDVEFDTMLASQILTAGLNLGNGLAECYERYLGIKLDKADRKFFSEIHPSSPLTNRSVAYSGGDVTQLKELASMQFRELEEKGLLGVWALIEKPFLPILTKAKLAGVPLDRDRLTQIEKELEEIVRLRLEQFESLVGTHTYVRGKRTPVTVTEPNINIASWQQLTEWYYGAGVEVTGTGEEILSEVLKSRRSKRVKEFTQCVLDYRRDSKILGTYVKPLLERSALDGKIHPNWKQMVDTGRMACREPNLQNIPSKGPWAKIRECFIAEPGHKLIIADYSQMELRILAQLSQEPKMLEAFRNGEDLHAKTAAAIFGPDYTKEQRQVAKIINFGTAYGAGPPTIAAEADISFAQAKALLAKFFGEYTVLKQYLDQSKRNAQDYCFAATPAGRKRFFKRPEPDAEKYVQQMAAIGREGCNAPIQGCNADATKRASTIFAERTIEETDVQIVMWIHDEIVVQVPDDSPFGSPEAYAELLKSCMIEAAQRYVTDIPVEVSITIGDRWQK